MSEIIRKIRKFVPAVSFFGGFAWDSLTLGRLVQSSDLLFLLFYYLAAFAILLLLSATPDGFLHRSWGETWQNRFTYGVQFCFGSLASALVVCYFKSSGSMGAFLLVSLFAVLLVSNEFLQKRYARFGFSLALFSLFGTMFLNFVIPHLVGGIGFGWFLLSVLVSLGVCYLAYRISHRSRNVLIAPVGVSALLVIAYLANWIPPVPLVLKDQNACVGYFKGYSCHISEPGFWERLGLGSPTIHLSPEDGGVYFLSSVFAPSSVEAQLEHRWFYENPNTGKFELMNKISSGRMRTHGSREDGFRIYTKKKNVPFGKWKVETAVKDGAVIGSRKFRVVPAGDESPERIPWSLK